MRLLYSTRKEDFNKALSNLQGQTKEIAKSWRLAKKIIRKRTRQEAWRGKEVIKKCES